MLDHSYSLDIGSMKRKYSETLQKLEEKETKLQNSLRREKRAKLSVASLLQHLREKKRKSYEVTQVFKAYKGIGRTISGNW